MNGVRISSVKKCLPKQALSSLANALLKLWMLTQVVSRKHVKWQHRVVWLPASSDHWFGGTQPITGKPSRYCNNGWTIVDLHPLSELLDLQWRKIVHREKCKRTWTCRVKKEASGHLSCEIQKEPMRLWKEYCSNNPKTKQPPPPNPLIPFG